MADYLVGFVRPKHDNLVIVIYYYCYCCLRRISVATLSRSCIIDMSQTALAVLPSSAPQSSPLSTRLQSALNELKLSVQKCLSCCYVFYVRAASEDELARFKAFLAQADEAFCKAVDLLRQAEAAMYQNALDSASEHEGKIIGGIDFTDLCFTVLQVQNLRRLRQSVHHLQGNG